MMMLAPIYHGSNAIFLSWPKKFPKFGNSEIPFLGDKFGVRKLLACLSYSLSHIKEPISYLFYTIIERQFVCMLLLGKMCIRMV